MKENIKIINKIQKSINKCLTKYQEKTVFLDSCESYGDFKTIKKYYYKGEHIIILNVSTDGIGYDLASNYKNDNIKIISFDDKELVNLETDALLNIYENLKGTIRNEIT